MNKPQPVPHVTLCPPGPDTARFQMYSHDDYLGRDPLGHRGATPEAITGRRRTLYEDIGDAVRAAVAAIEAIPAAKLGGEDRPTDVPEEKL